jgi:type I restriction enzyme S subunit
MKHDKPYPAYKNSSIAWIGEVPDHWEFKRAKWVFREIDVRSETGNEELLSVSEHYGVIKRKNANVTMFQAASYVGYKLCKPGDLVINSLWAWSRGLGFSNYNGIVSTAYGVYRPNPKEVSDYQYFHYLLRTKRYVGQFAIRSKGIWISRLQLSDTSFFDIPILLPPPSEQTVIARFLDYKLGKINRFIRKKKQLIKLLNEQKAAIINQAVTKGLNPNAPMKDSGVEWLGEVPEGWEKYKLKYLITKPIAGAWGVEPQNDSNDIICVRVADFKDFGVKTENLTIRNIDAKPEQILVAGDLLLEKSGGGEKTPVGRVVIFDGEFKAVTSNFVSKFSPKRDLIISEYLLFIFKLINGVKWNFKSLKQTTGIQNIDTYQYMDNWVFIPIKDEQITIVKHIKSEFIILDETIANIEKEITLVEEYKTALIAEAVTGKIDVRGYEVPEMESEEEGYEEMEEEMNMAAEDDAADYQTEEAE